MKDYDPGDANSGQSNEGGSSGGVSRRSRKRSKPAAGQPARIDAGRRVQRAAVDGMVAAGRGASERVAGAARKAKAATLPGLSRAKDEARQWSALDPDVKQQVILSLMTAATVGAGEHMKKHDHWGVKVTGVAIAAAGPAIATHAVRQVGKVTGRRNQKARTAETADVPGVPDEPGSADDVQEVFAPRALEPAILDEFADNLGVRRPLDPEDLYRDGPDVLEPLHPLPEGLASLPWGSLSRRDRFFVLVAAWALREADGVRLLQSGQLEQAREAFQECLESARHLQTPELVARSCENLGELAMVSGDEAGARKWREEAEVATR